MNNFSQRVVQGQYKIRLTRTDLLPLPTRIRDHLSLEFHLQIEVLRAGRGTLLMLQSLMRLVFATKMLGQIGQIRVKPHLLDACANAINEAFSQGDENAYHFDTKAIALLCEAATIHDEQLRLAPVKTIEQIALELEKPAV